ncbi:DUF1292 domain-containing protein [Clostridiales bacterium COT073_COT-073]|nr:DUF1292 domain-containing protein [Clostridiales bacterium COT073_COT-073]
MDRIVFTDENGNEVELDILSMAEYEGRTYILVTDELEDDGSEEMNVYIMREDEIQGEDAIYSMVDPETEDEEFINTLLDILEDSIPEEEDYE